jgi:hypothetical protein
MGQFPQLQNRLTHFALCKICVAIHRCEEITFCGGEVKVLGIHRQQLLEFISVKCLASREDPDENLPRD